MNDTQKLYTSTLPFYFVLCSKHLVLFVYLLANFSLLTFIKIRNTLCTTIIVVHYCVFVYIFALLEWLMLSDAFALLPCFIFNLRILLSISCKADALLTKSLVFFYCLLRTLRIILPSIILSVFKFLLLFWIYNLSLSWLYSLLRNLITASLVVFLAWGESFFSWWFQNCLLRMCCGVVIWCYLEFHELHDSGVHLPPKIW